MPIGPPVAGRIASKILRLPQFIEPALLVREAAGARDEHGEWQPGALDVTEVKVISIPVTGQERFSLPEGLRDEDVRKFWWEGDAPALRPGKTDGDAFVLGALGMEPHTFEGATQEAAEAARDAQAAAAGWLDAYQADPAKLVQLSGFGRPLWQFREPTLRQWMPAPFWRVTAPDRWGSFTELLAVRRDPGAVT